MKRLILPLLFLILSSLLTAEEGIVLEWEGRENYTYQIELKKYGSTVFIQRLSESRISLDLSPGEYSYQVTFFNKFDKADAYSDWLPLTVLKDLVPLIIEVPEHTLFSGDREQRLEILTADIMEGAQIHLEQADLSLPLEYEFKGKNSLELIIPTSSLAPGLYDLRITNPSGSETGASQVVELREKVNPLVTEISHKEAFIDEQIPRVILRGEHFDRDVVIFLERKGVKHRLPLSDYVNENEIHLWFDLTGLKPGSYNLLLINPPLEETLVTQAFTIVDPRKVRDENYYQNLRWGTDLLICLPLADALFEAPLSNITYVEGEGFFGPFPEIESVLRLDMIRDHPLAKYFGGTLRIAFIPPFDNQLFTTVNIGVYGRTRFNSPVNLFTEGMLGYRWMDLESEDSDISEEGSLLTWGGGLLINYDRYLLETSFRRDFWLLKGNEEISLSQLTLRLGYRF
ncbi:MAG: hypothetical protein PQJ60_14640 [Spirochaetales bacterium]|nr:hypothetical protein [Spirochaetales bacterium]